MNCPCPCSNICQWCDDLIALAMIHDKHIAEEEKAATKEDQQEWVYYTTDQTFEKEQEKKGSQ